MANSIRNYRAEWMLSANLLLVVVATILYGAVLADAGYNIRQWQWVNLLYLLPIVPMIFMQSWATLPRANDLVKTQGWWWKTAGIGMIFGVLDVLVIKVMLHPEPYDSLPPFLQPFPYSLFLYTAGALDVELYYRILPLTLLLLADKFLFKSKYRTVFLWVVGIVTSLIEPIMQFPGGAWWFMLYATLTGIAMNAWQFWCYAKHGLLASLAVRLGHYLVWHILLGLYVQYIELA
ncbi:MAG TPA: hypothetical protein VLL95_16440 [Phnomibacter sp.]|nr:hypothetical protein [Phnomibacter sp.]